MSRDPSAAGGSAVRLKHDVAWGTLLVGWIAAFVVGLGSARVLEALGWWVGGAAWERAALAFANSTVTPWLDPIFLGIPFFGTNYTLVPFIAVAAILLWRRGHRLSATHLAVVQLGSWVLNPSLKNTLMRPRPDIFELRGQFGMSAYPSGHSIAVTSVLFTVAYLLDRHGYGRYWYGVFAVVFLINNYSRVYLGVHWPTDAIGGVLIGGIWLAVTMYVFHPLHHRYGDR